MASGLIIALDYDKCPDALKLVDQLDPSTCSLKIGNEMFTRFGPQFVTQLVNRKFSVFLDLKFHDIPNTVASACKAAADLGVWMINVHSAGGSAMMAAAKQALNSKGSPLITAVTMLTSMAENDLAETGIALPLTSQVEKLAFLAEKAGLDGVVCSAQEVSLIKTACSSKFITVTPGIRLAESSTDDQHRIMTPQQAVAAGSDYLVIGRPITRAPNPGEMVLKVLQMMNK